MSFDVETQIHIKGNLCTRCTINFTLQYILNSMIDAGTTDMCYTYIHGTHVYSTLVKECIQKTYPKPNNTYNTHTQKQDTGCPALRINWGSGLKIFYGQPTLPTHPCTWGNTYTCKCSWMYRRHVLVHTACLWQNRAAGLQLLEWRLSFPCIQPSHDSQSQSCTQHPMCQGMECSISEEVGSACKIMQSICILAEAAIYSSLKMYGCFVLSVETKMRVDRRRLVAGSTNLTLNIHKTLQPLSYPCILRSYGAVY